MTKKDPKTDALVASTGVDVAKLASYRSQATELEVFLDAAPCRTAVQEQWFSEQLANVRGLTKLLEEERTKVTKPLLAAKAAVDALFRPATGPLKKCEDIIRDKLKGAAQARLDAECVALLAATVAAAVGESEAAVAALAAIPEAVATTGSSTGSKWVVEHADVTAMPVEYLLPDIGALEKLANAAKDGPAPVVAGVVFKRVATLRAKAV